MDIKVLGTGCANCRNTIALIEQVAQAKGVAVNLQKVEELRDIMSYGVMSHARRGDRRQGRACRRRAEPRQDRTVADYGDLRSGRSGPCRTGLAPRCVRARNRHSPPR